MVIEYTLGRDKYDYPFTTAAKIHACQMRDGLFLFAEQP
jgi:hypothetical protein